VRLHRDRVHHHQRTDHHYLKMNMIYTALGWCASNDHQNCPGYYRSKVNPNIVDLCFCECHTEGNEMRDPEQVENEAWISCLAIAGLTVIFGLGVIFALIFL
jgi:hypothetical protein